MSGYNEVLKFALKRGLLGCCHGNRSPSGWQKGKTYEGLNYVTWEKLTKILFFSGSRLLPCLVRFKGIFNLRNKLNLDGWKYSMFVSFMLNIFKYWNYICPLQLHFCLSNWTCHLIKSYGLNWLLFLYFKLCADLHFSGFFSSSFIFI